MHVNPIVLPVDASGDRIRAQLSDSLRDSERVLPHPAQSEWKGLFDPFLKAAGVRSFRSFMQAASMLMVEQNDTGMAITPMRNAGPRGGFQEILEERMMLPNDEQAAAEAVLRILRVHPEGN